MKFIPLDNTVLAKDKVIVYKISGLASGVQHYRVWKGRIKHVFRSVGGILVNSLESGYERPCYLS